MIRDLETREMWESGASERWVPAPRLGYLLPSAKWEAGARGSGRFFLALSIMA